MRRRLGQSIVAAALVMLSQGAIGAVAPDVRGAWRAETYTLKGGQKHTVKGLIFFTKTDWTVLFFVTPNGQAPQRGSAEGGTYTLADNVLVFTHVYNLSIGKAVDGMPESPLRMEVKDAGNASTEPSRVDLSGDRLTIYFPSGNALAFQRSSRFE